MLFGLRSFKKDVNVFDWSKVFLVSWPSCDAHHFKK